MAQQTRRRNGNGGSNGSSNGNAQGRRPNPGQRPAPKKSGGGGLFALFLIAVIVSSAAAFVLFPEKVKELIFGEIAQKDNGDTQEGKPTQGDQDNTPAPLVPTATVKTTEPEVLAPVKPTVTETVTEVKSFNDEKMATAQIHKAQSSYQDFQWTDSRNLANKILNMNASPEVKSQARSLISKSKDLQALMKRMTSKTDGMVRGIYLSDSLALLHMQNGGAPILVVPIKSLNDKTIIKTADGAKYINSQLESTGKVYCMTEKGIAAEYKSERVLEVTNPDRAAIQHTNNKLFTDRYLIIVNHEFLKNDAVALYELARFGYHVGADEKVVAVLERAILIEPNLAETVRNDRARAIFDKLVRVMKKNPDSKSAAGFVGQLKKHYKDTSVCAEAIAYYKGDRARVAQLQKEDSRRKKEERDHARQEKKKKAEKEGNTDVLEKLAEIEEVEATEATAVAAVKGDEAKADALWDEGSDYLSDAILNAADDGTKDRLLKKAFKTISKAYNIYCKLAEDGSQSAMNKLPECGQDKYLAKKTMRP